MFQDPFLAIKAHKWHMLARSAGEQYSGKRKAMTDDEETLSMGCAEESEVPAPAPSTPPNGWTCPGSQAKILPDSWSEEHHITKDDVLLIAVFMDENIILDLVKGHQYASFSSDLIEHHQVFKPLPCSLAGLRYAVANVKTHVVLKDPDDKERLSLSSYYRDYQKTVKQMEEEANREELARVAQRKRELMRILGISSQGNN